MDWFKDVRFGARLLLQQPAFTALATLTLALGIGANTAIFTIFDALLLRSLPVREPERLVLFSGAPGEGTSVGNPPTERWHLFSYDVYQHLRRQPLPFESLAAFRSGEAPVAVRLAGQSPAAASAERAQAHLVAGNYFHVMGVAAALGRTLAEADDRPNAAPVAVVSDGFWKSRLQADPGIVGKVAIVNGTAVTIAGVAPPEFFGERVRRPPDLWIPLVFQPQIELRPSFVERRDVYWLNMIGRLTRDGTREQAEAAVTTALRQFLRNAEGARLTPERERQIQLSRVELEDGAAGISGLRQRYSEPLHVLLGVVLLVLLIACANVGNLLLARAAARRGEVSVRMALGATPARIVRQLLVESLLLAGLGAACAIVLARWVVGALLALVASPGTPVQATLNGPVLAATIGLTFVAGALFGLAPAIQSGRVDIVAAMKSGLRATPASRVRYSASGLLVAAQIAVSLVLLVGAGLFARSLINLQQQPLGFDRDRVLLARINSRLGGYKPTDVGVLYRRVYDRLRALPGVTNATLASYSPFSGSTTKETMTVEGYAPKPGEDVETENIYVAPSYAETLGIRLVAGRTIGPMDGAGAPLVAMVNQAFVRRYLPGANAIGRQFRLGDRDDAKSYEIVGVLEDARFHNARDPIEPIAFMALLQDASQFALSAEAAVQTSGDPAAAANELRQAIAEVDRNVPVNDPRPLAAQVSQSFDTERLAARLVTAFGALALLLACVGLYGVVSQAVARRTNEIGVRMALGAERRDVLWMILRETLTLVCAGVAVGLPAALAGARLVRSQLFGLGAADPASFTSAAIVLTSVAIAAALFPARRASRVDPMVALRYE